MAFSAIDKMPGVYIDEVQTASAIAGVATSNVAIVGPARRGPIGQPTRVTSPTRFNEAFGITVDGRPWDHLTGFYASHAVHGFFANGGSNCWFVRVATAARANRQLMDRAAVPNATIDVVAREEGVAGNGITVEVQDAALVTGVQASRAETTVAGAGAQNATAEVADASAFRPGDIVFVDGGGNSERATIDHLAGNTITLRANLTHSYAAGALFRIADLEPGQQTIRLADVSGLSPGSSISITQGATTEDLVVQAVEASNGFVTLDGGLTNTYTMANADPAVSVASLEFNLIITHPSAGAENFTQLAMDQRHPRYFGALVLSDHVDVRPVDPPNVTSPPANRPAVLTAANLAGGQNDDPSSLGSGHYTAAIDTLERVDEINLLCVPDRTDLAVQAHMLAHCEATQDRFAILDPQRGADVTAIGNQRAALSTDRGFGALYYPRLVITDPDPNVDGTLTVPPSGHIAGIYARTDTSKGVHKAPANEAFARALGLEAILTETEAGILNEQSVNVLRRLPNRGIRVWGARTLATRTQWRYVNVRRLVLFIEESIQEATSEAVFEPNNPALWQTLKRQVSDFLTRVWRSGALFGNVPEEAFRVRVDEELNPPSQLALGILTLEVVLRPTTPAEFIVFRIIADPSQAIIQE